MTRTGEPMKKKQHMTMHELRRRMQLHRVLGAAELAKITGYNVSTTYRWLTRETGISRAVAAMLREKLPMTAEKKAK